MRYLKASAVAGCCLVLALMIWSMSHWNESRGVYDDICYLRQAHLFQTLGWRGFNTDLSLDSDRYLESRVLAVGLPSPQASGSAPCHNAMPATGKVVLQYPPGTGLLLATFPSGFQVIPLYVISTLAIFIFGLLALQLARAPWAIVLTATFADLAIYLMINPAKASYSVAPTLVICAMAGWLTARLWVREPQSAWLAGWIGLLFGFAVDLRVANLFLAAGYGLYLLGAWLVTRNRASLNQGLAFAAALLIGMSPTLLANAINAGSPFRTTYGSADAVPPAIDFTVLKFYVSDMQFVLLVIALAILAGIWRLSGTTGLQRLGWLVLINIVVNFAFFLSHPLFTPYYTVPISMLSLWTLVFGCLMVPVETMGKAPVQAAPRR